MRLDTGRRVDAIAASAHEATCADAYAGLALCGIRTTREALRWHLIQPQRGHFDWTSALAQIRAARQSSTQVIWDLAHFGLPDWVDPWASSFPEIFGDFAEAAARFICRESDIMPMWSPINEISYWAYASGHGHFAPLGIGRGAELKQQLVRATIAAIGRIRSVQPGARFLQPEPAIHVTGDSPVGDAESQRVAMFEAWDWISGRAEPALGGRIECLDLVGINYYSGNQWTVSGDRLGIGDGAYRPLSQMLMEISRRYDRPLMISETGAEGANLAGWLRYVSGEVEDACRQGVTVSGLCLYPVADYPGWTDDRHCQCGLLAASDDWRSRTIRPEIAALLKQGALRGPALL